MLFFDLTPLLLTTVSQQGPIQRPVQDSCHKAAHLFNRETNRTGKDTQPFQSEQNECKAEVTGFPARSNDNTEPTKGKHALVYTPVDTENMLCRIARCDGKEKGQKGAGTTSWADMSTQKASPSSPKPNFNCTFFTRPWKMRGSGPGGLFPPFGLKIGPWRRWALRGTFGMHFMLLLGLSQSCTFNTRPPEWSPGGSKIC